MNNKKISNVILGTGSFDTVKSGNTVSITVDRGNDWGYFGPSYKKLAPKLATYIPYEGRLDYLNELKKNLSDLKEYLKYRKQIEEEYIKSYYETRLKELDIEKLMNVLMEKFGNNIILLCHEPVDEFCHRRVLADYIELKTGIYIPELSVTENGVVDRVEPISYKSRIKNIIYK